MKILKAEIVDKKLRVESELDGDLIIRDFSKGTSDESIKKELLASEKNIKQEKKEKIKYEKEQLEDIEANKTIKSLLSKK